jgi:hypothetical protein
MPTWRHADTSPRPGNHSLGTDPGDCRHGGLAPAWKPSLPPAPPAVTLAARTAAVLAAAFRQAASPSGWPAFVEPPPGPLRSSRALANRPLGASTLPNPLFSVPALLLDARTLLDARRSRQFSSPRTVPVCAALHSQPLAGSLKPVGPMFSSGAPQVTPDSSKPGEHSAPATGTSVVGGASMLFVPELRCQAVLLPAVPTHPCHPHKWTPDLCKAPSD